QAHRPGKDALRPQIDILEVNALFAEHEFADLVGVGHAPRLEDVDAAVALAAQLNVAQEQPGVDEGGETDIGGLQRAAGGGQVQEQSRNLCCLEEIDQADQYGAGLKEGARGHQVA